MKCDRYEVLYQVVRIANSSLDLDHTCKSLLRLLQKTLRPNALTLFLLAPNRASFTRRIESTGSGFFLPCSRRPSATLDTVALQSRLPVQEGDLWCFPVFSGRRNFGVLHLQMPPGQTLPAACQDALRITGDEMAKLLRLEQSQKREGQRQTQLSVLAELGLELNRAETFDDLLKIGLPILLRHRHADCAILRPLHAGALLGEGQLRLRPACAQWKDLFLLLEEEYAAAALTETHPFFRRLPARLCRGKAVPAEVVFIPLVVGKRVLGILSLFGSDGASEFPFTATAIARQFFAAVGTHFALAFDRIGSRERLEALSRENDRKLQETALLYRISRAIHSALHLDELMHLILAAAVAPGGGGFERAMLFTINERTETLQGILCIAQDRAALVIPPENHPWDKPVITAEMQQTAAK